MMEARQLRDNYFQLGVAACKAGQLDLSARLLEAGVQECRRLKLEDLISAGLLYNLAVVNHRRGLPAGVESLLLECLKICRKVVKDDHPAITLVSRLLASHYYESGNLELAGYYYRQVMKKTTAPAQEQIDDLVRLAKIEHASAHHKQVQKICHKIYTLQGSDFAQPKSSPIAGAYV
jgi:hypothetical protein